MRIFKILGLVFLIGAVRLMAVSCTEWLSFSSSLSLQGGSGNGYVNFYGKGSTVQISMVVNGGESSPVSLALLTPGAQYTFSVLGYLIGQYQGSNLWIFSGGYTVGFTAPDGYSVYINGYQNSVCSRTFNTSQQSNYLGFNDTYTIAIYPVADSSSAPAGIFSGIELDRSVTWQVGLGAQRSGQSAGRITFCQPDLTFNTPNTSVASRNLLGCVLQQNNGQITTITDTGGLRQVMTPQTFVDLVDFTCQKQSAYTMNFYRPTQVTLNTSGNPNIYTINSGATPWKTIQVTPLDASGNSGANRLTITETEGSAVRVSSLVLTSGTVASGTYVWTLQEGDGTTTLRTTTHSSINNGGTPSTRDDVMTVRTGGSSGTVVSQTKYHYEMQPWGGEEVTKVFADPNGANLTTTYTYYAAITAPGNYGRVQSVTDPSGNWRSYLYYDDWSRRGQVQIETRPFVGTPATWQAASTTVGRSVLYDYWPDDYSGRSTIPTTQKQYTNGVLTGQELTTPTVGQVRNSMTFTSYQSNDYSSASVSQQSIREVTDPKNYPSDFNNLVLSMKRPDQSQDSYAYYLGTYTPPTFAAGADGNYFRTNVWHGTTNPSNAEVLTTWAGATIATIYLVPNKSTMDVTIQDPAGNVVHRETWVYTGGGNYSQLTSCDLTYDYAGRLLTAVASNGSVATNTYANGRLSSTVDATGIETDYTYDVLGRVLTSVKAGVTANANGTSYPAQANITTTYTYDGANHVTTTAVSGGPNTLTSTAAYDLAGRLTQQVQYSVGAINSLTTGLTTGYTYTVGNGSIVTATLPGKATRITTNNLDGQLNSITGTGVIYEFLTYSVDPGTGNYITTQQLASTSSPALTTTTNDWLGRRISFVQPALNGTTATTTTQSWFYNTSGQLYKSSQTGLADTLYVYDALGRLYRQGLDIEANGTLDLTSTSTDRITESNASFVCLKSNWYLQTTTATYAPGSATPTITSTKNEQLSGFTGSVQSETDVYDIYGNKTSASMAVNRSQKLVTTTSVAPNSTTNAVQIGYNGLLMSAQDTAGVTMTYGYDDLGRPTQSIDPRTKGTGPTPLATTTAYLSKTNLVYTITDPAGTVQATYTYDSAGRVNSVMNALGKFARCDYNLLGQKLHEWGDTPNPVLYTYDPNYGWQTKLTTYRAGTGWTGTTWPTATGTGDTTIWAFDPGSGLLLSKTDAASNAVSYSYTQPGQVYTRTWARNIVNTNTKIVTTYDYSSTTGELTGVTYNDGTPSVSYFYNRLGEMASADDATDINAIGTHTFTYNQNGGLELDSENLPAFFNNRLLTYTYDTTNTGTKGRSTGFELGNSANPKADQSVVYGYQLDGRLSSVTGGGRIFTYGYLSNSHLINTVADTTVPTPVTYTDTQKYDAAHDWTASRTTTWGPTTGTPLASFSYTPDIMGRIYQVNKTGALFSIYGAGSLTTKYGYDDRSELTSEKTTDSGNVLLPPRNDSYVFDNMGNRQNPVTHNGNTAIYTPNNLNQYTQRTVPGIFDVTGSAASTATITVNGSSTGVIRDGQYFFDPFSLTNTPNDVFATLNISEGTTNVSLPAFLPAALQKFQYDYDGNLTDDGHWQYTYDAENRLTFMQIDQAALKANVPNQKIAFTYDYLGRRVQKTASNLTGGNWVVQDDRRFIYQGNNLIAEINSNTLAVIKSYYWGLDLSGSGQGAGGVGGLLMAQDSSGSYLPMYDAMGNVHGLIAATSVTLGGTVYPAGSIVAAYEYDASGQTLRESGPYAASNPIGYSTKYTDLETGLIYFGRRYYSPTLGRFINRDPIEEAGGSNLYAFCGNNGVNNLDYLGMDTGQTIDNITYNQAPYDPGSGMSGWLPAFQEALRGFYGAAWSNWSNYLFNLNGPEPWIYLFDNGECGNGPLDRLAASARRDQANYVAAAAAAYNAVHPQAPNSSATTPAQNNDPKNNQDTATGQTRTETDPKTGKTYIVTNDPNYDPTGMTLVAWGTNYGSFSNGSVVRGGSNAGMVAENNGVLGTIGANNTWSSGRTLIMIGYTTVVGRLDHSFTIAIDLATGTQTIGRGGPSSDVDGAFATSWDPWGTILGRFRTWTETPGAFDDPSKTINTQFVGATSANSSSIVNQMVNFAQLVNQNPMLYWPQGPNSNSYTYSLISYLGFTPPTPVHTVPGWGRNIIP